MRGRSCSILAVVLAASVYSCAGRADQPTSDGSGAAIDLAQAPAPASAHAGHAGMSEMIGSGDGTGEPIGLKYICDNRFVVTNSHARPVTIRYRVVGTKERGSVRMAAAPDEDPGFSEAVFETRAAGRVAVSLGGRVARTASNDGVPCEPVAPVARAAAAAAATTPAQVGQWGAKFSWPIVAVHLNLLPNGQVVSWGLDGDP